MMKVIFTIFFPGKLRYKSAILSFIVAHTVNVCQLQILPRAVQIAG